MLHLIRSRCEWLCLLVLIDEVFKLNIVKSHVKTIRNNYSLILKYNKTQGR